MNHFYVYIYFDPRKKGLYLYEDLTFEYEPFYVGKGKDDRMYTHLTDKSGCNVIKENIIKDISDNKLYPIIIKYKENISEEEAYAIEIDLIDKIGRIRIETGPLSNYQRGGLHVRKGKRTTKSKLPINQYTLDGNFIRTWPGASDINDELGFGAHISSVCRNKRHHAYGFVWRFHDDSKPIPQKIETTRKQIWNKGNPGYKNKRSKTIYQFDLNGNFIKSWISHGEIFKETGFSHTSTKRCCMNI